MYRLARQECMERIKSGRNFRERSPGGTSLVEFSILKVAGLRDSKAISRVESHLRNAIQEASDGSDEKEKKRERNKKSLIAVQKCRNESSATNDAYHDLGGRGAAE